jgi:L-asparaginase
MLEDSPLYNSAHGAVFTRAGTIELEASIMVSKGYRKRGVGCMMLSRVKNPIKLCREVLVRGEEPDGGGVKDHCLYNWEAVEGKAQGWGLQVVDPGYFWTEKRWKEHKRGLEEEKKVEEARRVRNEESEDWEKNSDWEPMSEWEKNNYIPLGTCGAVVLDRFGTICVATSTGGLTNKVPGRIGDTPTMGAGYWAEQWFEDFVSRESQMLYQPSLPQSPIDRISRGDVRGLVGDCLPSLSPPIPGSSHSLTTQPHQATEEKERPSRVRHAVGMSGSGNGDTFIRLVAARTVAAKSRFQSLPLSKTLPWMAGRGGELQRSAGDRWGHVHEGVGGMIGIELVGDTGNVVCDYNCGGMFRAWNDEDGKEMVRIFTEDSYESGPP